MNEVVTASDRFAAIIADPQSMDVIGQRVIAGETLVHIARSWQVPIMRFVTWVVDDLGRCQQYNAAQRARAMVLAHETIAIADGVDEARVVKDEDGKVHVLEPDSRRDALRVRTRFTMAGHLDRESYGNVSRQEVDVTHRKHASELTDEELLAIIENARRDAIAINAQSTEAVRHAELPPVAGTGPEDLI